MTDIFATIYLQASVSNKTLFSEALQDNLFCFEII